MFDEPIISHLALKTTSFSEDLLLRKICHLVERHGFSLKTSFTLEHCPWSNRSSSRRPIYISASVWEAQDHLRDAVRDLIYGGMHIFILLEISHGRSLKSHSRSNTRRSTGIPTIWRHAVSLGSLWWNLGPTAACILPIINVEKFALRRALILDMDLVRF